MSDPADKQTATSTETAAEVVTPAVAATTSDTGGAAATLLGGKPEVLVDAKATNGADKDPAAPTNAPTPYGEFTLPEGFTLDKALLDKVTPTLQKAGITQETAQELVTSYSQQLKEAAKAAEIAQQTAYAETLKTWEASIKSDPEFGGAKFDASVAAARKVVAKFGSPELGKLLDSTGLGTNPDFFRFVAKISGAFSEAPVVNGNASNQSKTKSDEMIMFPSMQHLQTQ